MVRITSGGWWRLPDALGSSVTRLADGWQGGPELVCGPEVPQSPVGQLPHQALAVGHHALRVVLVQLGHHHVQTVDENF